MNAVNNKKPLNNEGLLLQKKKLFFLYIIFCSNLLIGQQFNIGDQDGSALTDSRFQNLMMDIRNDIRKYNPTLIGKKVKGSPYFNSTFSLGKIKQHNDFVGKTFYLRYNAYNDEIEIGANLLQKEAKEAVLKRNDIECYLEGEVYFYRNFKDKSGKINSGYLIPFFNKESLLIFKRKRKIFYEETIPTTSLERGFPPRFIEEIQFFVSRNNQTPDYLGNDIKEVIKNLPSDIKDEIKEKKITLKSIKNETDLFNSLNQIFK